MTDTAHAAHFDSAARQAHAARLGMWVFLGSELLLFAGLFALYAAGRQAHPEAFRVGVLHSTKTIGSLNTAVLLISSTSVALSPELLRARQKWRCVLALAFTVALGVLFVILKLSEYAAHFRDGIFPGGAGSFFVTHPASGLALFWTLYFVTTGLHAIHVSVGLIILTLTAVRIARDRLGPERLHSLHNATLYWHLIDLVWIFLWPLYYLA